MANIEFDLNKMSEFGLERGSSMEEYAGKERFFIKKNYSTNDVSTLNFTKHFNKTTYQPYIPNYPKLSNLQLNGASGRKDSSAYDLGKTLTNYEFNSSPQYTKSNTDHNYSDKYGNGQASANTNGRFKDGFETANSGFRDGYFDAFSSADQKNAKSAGFDSDHVCLSGKGLEEFRTRQCPLYAKGMCLNSSRCSLSHSETWPRRNPVLFKYDYKLCPNIQFSRHDNKMQLHGKCSFGRRCRFSHSKEEQLYHPELYKTRYCLNYPNCKGYYCPFAHSKEELRGFQPSNTGLGGQSGVGNGLNNTTTANHNSSALNSSPTNTNGFNNNYGGSNGLNTPNNSPIGSKAKYRPPRDNSVFRSRNEFCRTNYKNEDREGNSVYKSGNEELSNNNSPFKAREVDDSLRRTIDFTNSFRSRNEVIDGYKSKDESNYSYLSKDEWNNSYLNRNDDVLSNTTSAYSTYVEDLDLELSSTYDNTYYHNSNGNDQNGYGNQPLFNAEDDRAYNAKESNDNKNAPNVADERDGPVSENNFKQDDEEDENWFESLIKNGLDSLEDNPANNSKSWPNEEDIHEVFNNLRDCSLDPNCPFCSIKKEYKFTDSEQMLKLSEAVFKPWSLA